MFGDMFDSAFVKEAGIDGSEDMLYVGAPVLYESLPGEVLKGEIVEDKGEGLYLIKFPGALGGGDLFQDLYVDEFDLDYDKYGGMGKGAEKYPWDQCIQDQLDAGHDQESAEKICGSIKAKNADYGEYSTSYSDYDNGRLTAQEGMELASYEVYMDDERGYDGAGDDDRAAYDEYVRGYNENKKTAQSGCSQDPMKHVHEKSADG
ncbi:MAG: hypothetical protein JRN42_04465, partial [Nitrososphaerota archaeon]|nr:hypothetical protein [Nitrososphaerota archaeon]